MIGYAQMGTISGVMTDDDGLPIPGVNIIIKGTTQGTQTDFDGEYSINCKPGDVLVFSYVGMRTKELIVTHEMLESDINEEAEYIYVNPVKTNAYAEALKRIERKPDTIRSVDTSDKTFNKNKGYFQYNRIKSIEIEEDKVKLTYFKPDIYFEAGFSSSLGIRYVRDKNLPKLQNRFSQGNPVDGSLSFQGGETNNIFSYGPAINLLEFDGSDYNYDTNGQLVNLGNGNGNPAVTYDNPLFDNAIVNSNQVYFNISTEKELIELDFSNKNYADIYNRELSADHNLILRYNNPKSSEKMGWKGFVSYNNSKNRQPNINAFQNNLILNQWVTPPTFSNTQGILLPNETQRRFSSQFNNPEWLLQNNRNRIENNNFTGSVINEVNLSKNIELLSNLNYTYNDELQKFGVFRETAGFEDGFYSDKNITTNNINAGIVFKFKKEFSYSNELKFNSKADYNYEDLSFYLQENIGLNSLSFDNATNVLDRLVNRNRSLVKLFNKVEIDSRDGYSFKLINNSYYSSVQNNKWFLPGIEANANFDRIFDMYGPIYDLKLSASYSKNINDMPLYYDNLSHNSLLISPVESLSYTSNNDLFIRPDVQLEEVDNFELNLDFSLTIWNNRNNFSFGFYSTQTNGNVFPVIEEEAFELQNVADVRTYGFEFEYASYYYIGRELRYEPKINFSTYTSEVTNLFSENDRVTIAGFSTVSKNLIKNQPTGAIVGSAYLRDEQNNLIIGGDGFPLVNSDPQIIGNPIPDFNIGITQTLKWKKFNLEIVLDIQKGGDVWNGTQNVLNYVGTSQQSADERNITNFLFEGVNQQGMPNTIPVDFYNPENPIVQNRFVRYGFEGVAEDAIEDGSYINLRSINLSYDFYNMREGENNFIKKCKINLYANNLMTWSKFRGRTPYSTFFGNRSANALNFFNTPLVTEIGLGLQIKI